MQIHLRPATLQDCAEISAIAITTWVDTYCTEGVDSVYGNYVIDRFSLCGVETLINEKHVYIAKTDFGLCGFAVISELACNQYELDTMYILPNFQNMKIGKSFIQHMHRQFNGTLHLKCADNNKAALAFYRNNGFKETGVTWFELNDTKFRCLTFKIFLKGKPEAAASDSTLNNL